MDSKELYNLVASWNGKHPATTMDFEELYAGLNAEIAAGNVFKQTNPDGDLEIFGYTIQCAFGKLWNTFSLMARGLILCPAQKKIVALTFPKFFNFGEGGLFVPDAPFSVTEKVDGCCEESVILQTEDGPKSIKKICDTKYNGKVLSFDIERNIEEYDNVVGHFVKNMPTDEDWYEIEVEDGTKVILTGNHRIWLPDLFCYRQVKDLNGDEKILQIK